MLNHMNLKRIVSLCIGMMAIAASSHGQIMSGSWLIGGSAGFGFGGSKTEVQVGSVTTSTKVSTSNVIVSPRAGYFLIDNLAVGVDLDLSGYGSTERDGVDIQRSSTTFFTVGPFVRYYIPLGEVYPFIEGGVGFGSVTYKNSLNNVETKTTHGLMDIGVGPGLAVFVTDNVAIEGLLRFIRSSERYDFPPSTEVRIIDSGMQLSIGVQAYILQ
jgi:outer membrane protein